MELGESDAGVDHSGAARKAQKTAGSFQARIAANDGPDGGAVNMRDVRKIKNDEGLFRGNKGFGFLLKAAAVRSGIDAAFHSQDREVLLGVGLVEKEDHDATLHLKLLNL